MLKYFSLRGRLRVITLATALVSGQLSAVELNKHGMDVVRLAGDEYNQIVNNNPVVTDENLNAYVSKVAKKLIPKGRSLPGKVKLTVAILDKAMPELYSTSNGAIIISKGAVLAVSNEAQLAAILAHEVAHILGAHYPSIYQAFKQQEAKQRSKMLASGIAGVVVGQAFDFALQKKTGDIYHEADRGNISYHQAMERINVMETAAGTIEGFKDVYDSLPPEVQAGSGDPRVPLEMVADAESLKLVVKAGYDPRQAAEAWRRLRQRAESARKDSTEALAMSFLPPQMRNLIQGVSDPMGGIRAEALTRTVSQNPPSRPDFLQSLSRSKEIVALSSKRKMTLGEKAFKDVIGGFVLGDAHKAFEAGDFATAKQFYQSAWDSGFKTAEVAYGLGQSQLGGFAFAATEQEKERAEEYLLKSTKLNSKFSSPYKALGELYGEWDRYEDAAAMYGKYLKVDPKAKDRRSIERKIKKMQRKAGR
ncbi:M48 family metalloprotease [Pseudomonadota bacterium]